MRWWSIAAVVLAVLSASPATAQLDEDEEPRRPSRMPRNFSDRPLTLPRDLFAVWGTLGGGQFTDNIAYVGLGAGADYGVNDDLEVGLELLRLTMSSLPGSGFGDPVGSITYRAVRGVYELGVRGALAVPLQKELNLSLSVPMLLRFAPYVRLDLRPEAHAIASSGWVFGTTTDALLRVQLGNSVSLGALAVLDIPSFEQGDVHGRFGGRFTYTFGHKNGGDADLSISALSPAVAFSGALPEPPSLVRYLSVIVEFRVFIEDTNDSPFEEEL